MIDRLDQWCGKDVNRSTHLWCVGGEVSDVRWECELLVDEVVFSYGLGPTADIATRMAFDAFAAKTNAEAAGDAS